MNFSNFPNGYRPFQGDFLDIQTNPQNHFQDIGKGLGASRIEGLKPQYDNATGELIIDRGVGIDPLGRRLNLEEDYMVDYSGVSRPPPGLFRWAALAARYELADQGTKNPDVGAEEWADRVEGVSFHFVEGNITATEETAELPAVEQNDLLLVDILLTDSGFPLAVDDQRVPRSIRERLTETESIIDEITATTYSKTEVGQMQAGQIRVYNGDPDSVPPMTPEGMIWVPMGVEAGSTLIQAGTTMHGTTLAVGQTFAGEQTEIIGTITGIYASGVSSRGAFDSIFTSGNRDTGGDPNIDITFASSANGDGVNPAAALHKSDPGAGNERIYPAGMAVEFFILLPL